MSPHLVRFFAFAALIIAVASVHTGAHGEELAQDEAQKVQAVIVNQLTAFAEEDADAAFETATPKVREAIGSSALFLALVRGNYPMVYRPASVSFLQHEQAEGSVLQLVEIKDDQSKSWLALFALERQPDNTWRIGGCLVAENHWRSV